jgi:hypothetical protein
VTRLPERYRSVSVTDVDVPLEQDALRELLTSRQVYRRTEYMVVRNGDAAALVRIVKSTSEPLFCDVDDVELLAGPDETVYLQRPDIDTGVPSQLALALPDASGARAVVVEGKYGHVNFLLDPTPVRLRVLDVEPPSPAKLVDQVRRVLDTADDLPDIVITPQVIPLSTLLPDSPPPHVLLQCRGGGMDVPGSTVDYLDEVPPARDWLLLGCARSRQIHDHFYSDLPGHELEQVDTCPRVHGRHVELGEGEVLFTKCCLLETHTEAEGRTVVVPWGASFAEVHKGLAEAAALAQESDAGGRG